MNKDKEKYRPKKKRNIGDPLPPKFVLIEYLRDLAKKLGHSPRIKDVREAFQRGEGYSYKTYQKVFGTLANGLKTAKLPLTKYYDLPDYDEVLKHICFLSLDIGRPLRTSDIREAISCKKFPYSRQIIVKHFKTIAQAIEIADTSMERLFGEKIQAVKFQKPTKEILIKQLRSIAKEIGKTPSLVDIKRLSKERKCYSQATFQDIFGSYTNAVKAASLKPVSRKGKRKFTEEGLLEMLRELAKKLGRTPTTKDVNENPDMPNSRTFRKYLGSYNNALEKAGLKLVLRQRYTEKKIIEDIKKLAVELNRLPSTKDVNEASKRKECVSENTICRRFGSLGKAYKKAGIQDMLDEIRLKETKKK